MTITSYLPPRVLLAIATVTMLSATGRVSAKDPATLDFTIERTVMTKGYDGKRCWVHARAGIIPAAKTDAVPTVVLTTQPLMITGQMSFMH